jgi:hypothetical protein
MASPTKKDKGAATAPEVIMASPTKKDKGAATAPEVIIASPTKKDKGAAAAPDVTMASPTKKDKGAAAPEAEECVQCLTKGSTKKGHGGAALTMCPKCKLATYCGELCRRAHWKAGHKKHCLTPEERRAPHPGPAAAPGARASTTRDGQGSNKCLICLDPLASGTVCTLPCTTPSTRRASKGCVLSASNKCAPCAARSCRRGPRSCTKRQRGDSGMCSGGWIAIVRRGTR